MISKFFIERPVLSNVIAILMILIGGVALFSLAVAQYPDVVPPTVQVTTRYPGASAKTVIDTVALPIEQQVNGVEDMLYMQSYSGSDGTYSLTVTFKIGTDLNFAQVLVQNRVSSALSQLPTSVQNQGVTVQKKSTAILLFVTLTSPKATYDNLFLSNYATISIRDELSRLPGVGNVTVFGAGQYSIPAIPATSRGCATSAGWSWVRRPTARCSRSTSGRPQASAYSSRPAPTHWRSRRRSRRRWPNLPARSRRTSSMTRLSTPQSSSRRRSRRSTRR
jgi:hypothetical protein